ncbi:MAG: hypothetical protein F6K24_51515 [Okeania sp. SIO2D1]|nr:hypothetical protein [Okeania sp. SIO2D1]
MNYTIFQTGMRYVSGYSTFLFSPLFISTSKGYIEKFLRLGITVEEVDN